MDFGKLEDGRDLNDIDLGLPPDPAATTEVLAKGKRKQKTKFYIGCAKWGRKDWVGKLYPTGTKEKDFLEYYARLFNCLEFNALFYKMPTREGVEKWKAKVPKGFLFCPKFTQNITHLKRLKNTDNEVNTFLEAVTAFEDSLGPLLLMPNPQMGPKQLDAIEDFIGRFPKDVPMFTELRHPDWYNMPEGYHPELYAFLRKQKRGTIITDAAGRRDCVHMHLSTPECFIRFTGNSLHPTDYKRIDDWVDRIATWVDQGLQTCYFFMHQHEELHSPELIKYFLEQLNKRCDTGLEPPVLESDGTLFG